jgi:hypothetical protein
MLLHSLTTQPGAGPAAVEELGADRRENGLHLVEGLARPADHHRQGAGFGALDAAAHGRVQHLDPALGQIRREAADEGWGVCREVDVRAAGLHGIAQPAGAEDDFLDLLRAWERGEDETGPAGDATGGLGRSDPFQRRQAGDSLRLDVEDRELMAGLGEMAGHVVAHSAKANKTEVHRPSPPSFPLRHSAELFGRTRDDPRVRDLSF